MPREASVYKLNWKEPTQARTERIAENLGIEGEVNDRGNGSFDIQGDQELYVSTGLVQFFSPDQPEEGDLPDDETAIGFAREWLRTAGLLIPELFQASGEEWDILWRCRRSAYSYFETAASIFRKASAAGSAVALTRIFLAHFVQRRASRSGDGAKLA